MKQAHFFLSGLLCLLLFGGNGVWSQNKKAVENEDVYKELKLKLKLTRVSLDFQETSLVEVFQFIRDVSGCNLVLDSHLSGPDYEDVKVTLALTDLPAQNCINLLCNMYKLQAVFTSGVLYIAPQDQIKEKISLRVYDTRDLVFQVKDFPGPKIGLGEKKDSGVSGAIFTIEPEKTVFNDAEKLLELIKETVDNDWEQEGQSISVHGNVVIALTTKKVHRKIEFLISQLRRHK